MASPILLPLLEQTSRPSVADMVFDELHRQILSLDLLPGTKISEVEIAKAMGISRQPVRDAFYRLSKIGFLIIRPQRATTVSKISLHAVLQARFIRTAIELETARVACHRFDNGRSSGNGPVDRAADCGGGSRRTVIVPSA